MTGLIEKLLPIVAIIATIAFAAFLFLSPRTDEELADSDFGKTIEQEEDDLDRMAADWELLAACAADRTRPDCVRLDGRTER